MKKLLLFLLLIPVWGAAQTPSKYLAGAVPVVDGKVTFTQTINVPGTSKEKLFDMVSRWAEEKFQQSDQFPNNKLITVDRASGEIGAIGEEYIVFSSSALSLDRTRIYYQLMMQCEEGTCRLTMTRIRYWYNEAREGGERYNAEECITDEFGLTKKQDKPARVIGKFRVKTIDYKDDLFKSLASSITDQLQRPVTSEAVPAVPAKDEAAPSVITIDPSKGIASTAAVQTVPAVQVAPATAPVVAVPVASVPKDEAAPVAAAPSALEGYTRIAAGEIPGNIYTLLSHDWMLITAGDKSRFNMMTASWGGLGNLYQRPVTFCFINPSRYTYRFMEANDTYTLSFYREEYREALKKCGSLSGRDTDKVAASGLTPLDTPSGNKAFGEAWLIIECRKVVAQSLNPEALRDEKLKQDWEGKAMHKMYIGEVTDVWMKR